MRRKSRHRATPFVVPSQAAADLEEVTAPVEGGAPPELAEPVLECLCGLDAAPDSPRLDLVCPKHDGVFKAPEPAEPAEPTDPDQTKPSMMFETLTNEEQAELQQLTDSLSAEEATVDRLQQELACAYEEIAALKALIETEPETASEKAAPSPALSSPLDHVHLSREHRHLVNLIYQAEKQSRGHGADNDRNLLRELAFTLRGHLGLRGPTLDQCNPDGSIVALDDAASSR